MAPSETELVARAKSDPSAYGELYRRHADRVYSYIYHRIGNVPDAEDLTARTFYRALVSISEYRDHGAPFAAWLFRIAHNLVANWRRDESRRDLVSLDCLDASWHGNDEIAGRTVHGDELLSTAIRRLDGDRQALLILKSQGLTNAEIASVLGRSEGAVKSLYHRTLEALRSDLLPDGGVDDPPTLRDEVEKTQDEPVH